MEGYDATQPATSVAPTAKMPADLQVAGILQYTSSIFLVGRNRGHRNRGYCGRRYWNRHFTEAIDAGSPVIIERRIDNAVVARCMVEAVFIGDDPNVRKITEEYERSELILLAGSGRCKSAPQGPRTGALEVDARRLERAPNKSRTIES